MSLITASLTSLVLRGDARRAGSVINMQVLHMILGLERLDRITMFIDEVASMPLGGGRGLSSRLDSRELPKTVAGVTDGSSAGTVASRQPGSGRQSSGEEWKQRHQDGTAVQQVRIGSAGPSPLGNGRSSMPDLHAPPPPVNTTRAGSASAFPLNPHRSYDEEWGTMPSGHDSDSDVYLTPHAYPPQSEVGTQHDDSSTALRQQQPPAVTHQADQQAGSPSRVSAAAHLSSQPWLQPSRRPPEPPHPRQDLPHSVPGPAVPSAGLLSTPERPQPSIPDRLHSPQHHLQPQPQAQHRSPSSLLSRASARIRVALEASEASLKGGPADPPPRQPGLPPSSGHRRTSSHQVPTLLLLTTATCMLVTCKSTCHAVSSLL